MAETDKELNKNNEEPKKVKENDPLHQTHEEHVAFGRMGGQANAVRLRRKKELKEVINAMLDMKVKKGALDVEPESLEEAQGKNLTIAEVMVLKQLEKAINGDTAAFVVLRDSAGMKPASKQEITATFENSPLNSILEQLKEDNEEDNKE